MLELTNPDGRALTLYSSQPIAPDLPAPSPFAEPQLASPHLRCHPLRGEWVTYAACRQNLVPPVPARTLACEQAHRARHGSVLLCDMARDEVASGRRLLYEGEFAAAVVPPCARYPTRCG